MADVTISAEGYSINCHRLVLCMFSDTLKKMFDSKPPNAQAFVYLHNVSPLALQKIVKFMYSGEVTIENQDLPTLMSTAESLKIKGLTELIQQQSETSHSLVETADDGLGDGAGPTTTEAEVVTVNTRGAAKRRRLAGGKKRSRASSVTTASADLVDQQSQTINDADAAPTRSSARNTIETFATNLDDGTAQSGIEPQQHIQTETSTVLARWSACSDYAYSSKPVSLSQPLNRPL